MLNFNNSNLIILNIIGPIKRRLLPLRSNFKRSSYSQSGEDLIIDYIFTQLGVKFPSYIDIGAHHPYYLSNTAYFYLKGSKGICVEPDPQLFKLFPRFRSRDINLNFGVGKEDGALILNVMNVPALNTFSAEEAERLVREDGFSIVSKKEIEIKSLNTIISQYYSNVFPDLLSLDVEGLDEVIIETIDFNLSKPTVICLETISFSQNGNGIKNNNIISYLERKGYMNYGDTNINTIFVLAEKWSNR